MATYNNIGDTIEGLALDGHTRRWQPKGLVKHKKDNKTMKLYSCDRNSTAVVSAVFPVPKDDNTEEDTNIPEDDTTTPEGDNNKKETDGVHRSLGDSLTADAIDVWVELKGKVSIHVEEGVSGRHGATLFSTKKHSIATIRTPLQNLLKKLVYTPSLQIE